MSMKFQGKFTLNKPLDIATFNFLKALAYTRRMKRKVDAKYGVEGEFYTNGVGHRGGAPDANVIDGNSPPKTQPSLWCQWVPSDDYNHIQWDGIEGFDDFIKWIEYIISKVLEPRGYILNGTVKYRGDSFGDDGKIEINTNMVNGKRLIIDYSINKLLGKVIHPFPKTTHPSFTITPPPKSKKKKDKKKDAQTLLLEAQIRDLEDKLREKDNELKNKKLVNVKDTMLVEMMKKISFGGSLDDFKAMLRNLLHDN